MTARLRCCVTGLVLLALPGLAWGDHPVVPWGTYPTTGGVQIRTKAKMLQHTTFTATLDVVSVLGGPVFYGGVGAGLPGVAGFTKFVGSLATARLSAAPSMPDAWVEAVTPLLRAYLESKGDTVQQMDVALAKWQGTAKFTTKPTPLFPLHKVKATINMGMNVTATMASGRTKKGTVGVKVTISGARPGIPGMD